MSEESFPREILARYSELFQRTVQDALADQPQYANYTPEVFVRVINDELIEEIKRRNANFSEYELSEAERAAYTKALVYQLNYVLTQGDFNLLSGYDVVSNTMLPLSELEKRKLAPLAKSILTNAGLLFPGLTRRGMYLFPRRRY